MCEIDEESDSVSVCVSDLITSSQVKAGRSGQDRSGQVRCEVSSTVDSL